MAAPNLVTLVADYYQKLPRGPYGLKEAWNEAKQADAKSTQRIILDTSELAWRAFFAAKKAAESQHGFTGKAELARLLNNLSNQSVEHQQAFAKQLALALAMDSDTLQPTNCNEDVRVRTGAKRRCMYSAF
jgi:hypothetical protein